jgi:hypothetical protein
MGDCESRPSHVDPSMASQTNPCFTIIWSVASGDDVADTIVKVAESGEDAGSGSIPARCDLIMMATHA